MNRNNNHQMAPWVFAQIQKAKRQIKQLKHINQQLKAKNRDLMQSKQAAGTTTAINTQLQQPNQPQSIMNPDQINFNISKLTQQNLQLKNFIKDVLLQLKQSREFINKIRNSCERFNWNCSLETDQINEFLQKIDLPQGIFGVKTMKVSDAMMMDTDGGVSQNKRKLFMSQKQHARGGGGDQFVPVVKKRKYQFKNKKPVVRQVGEVSQIQEHHQQQQHYNNNNNNNNVNNNNNNQQQQLNNARSNQGNDDDDDDDIKLMIALDNNNNQESATNINKTTQRAANPPKKRGPKGPRKKQQPQQAGQIQEGNVANPIFNVKRDKASIQKYFTSELDTQGAKIKHRKPGRPKKIRKEEGNVQSEVKPSQDQERRAGISRVQEIKSRMKKQILEENNKYENDLVVMPSSQDQKRVCSSEQQEQLNEQIIEEPGKDNDGDDDGFVGQELNQKSLDRDQQSGGRYSYNDRYEEQEGFQIQEDDEQGEEDIQQIQEDVDADEIIQVGSGN